MSVAYERCPLDEVSSGRYEADGSAHRPTDRRGNGRGWAGMCVGRTAHCEITRDVCQRRAPLRRSEIELDESGGVWAARKRTAGRLNELKIAAFMFVA